MTCIVGMTHNGKVYMAGDSWMTHGGFGYVSNVPKVFIHPLADVPMAIGWAGLARMGQILRYPFEPPMVDSDDLMGYMVQTFVPAVMKCFEEEKLTIPEDEYGPSFMVAFCGRLFYVGEGFSVDEVAQGYMAIGSARSFALGAMAAFAPQKRPRDRVEQAVRIAAQYDQIVALPVVSVEV
jgi:ATP-dependent protease HslVU (ClpYQ) peptidase subunit